MHAISGSNSKDNTITLITNTNNFKNNFLKNRMFSTEDNMYIHRPSIVRTINLLKIEV